MDPEKFIELQKQMRENNQEVADFLSDFGSWKEQVESKNAHLQNGKPTENKSLPAIRNSLFKKQKKKRGDKLTGSSKPESRRIRSSDYRAWDKFDVDKALEELDESDQRKEGEKNSESSETDEELENQRRLSLAKEARELGNLRFKEGNLQEAIEHYTTSARLTPEDPVPYTNRALAFLKSERYAAAESDCSAALALDSKCVKALFRRALARKGLQKKSEAIEDLKALLAIDENNKAAITELSLLTGRPSEVNGSVSQTSSKHSSSSASRVSLRGSRKFRRIPIVEVGSETGVHTRQTVAQKTQPKPVLSSGDAACSSSPFSNQSSPLKPEMTHHSATTTGDSTVQKRINLPVNTSTRDGISQDNLTSPVFVAPSNWYQLERDLRELNGGSTLSNTAVKYLCALEPVQYAKIISSNLEPSFLSKLLYALHATDQLTIEEIASRLDALSHLPRFDVAWCLADDRERDLFTQLLTRIESSHKPSVELKQRLRAMYM